MRSRRGTGLETGWFVKIVWWGLKLRCIAKFAQIFRPEDEPPVMYSISNTFNHTIHHC
jgi:hypothetical protein